MKIKTFTLLIAFRVFLAVGYGSFNRPQTNEFHYDSFIETIHVAYGTAGVIIVTAEPSYDTMQKFAIAYDICRKLSNKGVPSIVVTFDKFREKLPGYVKEVVRPLLVIGFHSMEEVHYFANISKDLDDSFNWLMIFIGSANQDICLYCRNPHGNLFNLRFDSQVIVLCCKSSIIEEWWSPMKHRMRRKKIGEWINENVTFHGDIGTSLYSRRHSLEGRELVIAATKGSAYIWEVDGAYYGFFGEMLNELSQSMNFTISKTTWQDSYGILDPKTSTWSGVIGTLQRREADIGVSPFCMTDQRLDAVDFTIPMAVGRSLLYMKKLTGARVQWKAYFKAFSMEVWMVIIGMILTMPLFLTLIRYRRHNYFFPMVIEHYSCVWGIYCQQGLSQFPKETPLRIVYVSIFISAVVTASVYSASLVSFLTVFSSFSPFNTVEEFSNDGHYKLLVLKESAQYSTYKMANDTFRKRMMSLMEPEESLPGTLKDGFNQLCGNRRVAFETNEAIRKTMGHAINCEITSIETGTIETFGMITPRHSEYLGLINHRIRQFKYNGMFKRLENKHFRDRIKKNTDYPKVHVEGLKPILYTLAGGFIITITILMIEIIFHHFKRQMKNWKKHKIIM